MFNMPTTLRTADTSKTVAVVGDVYRILADGNDTLGHHAMIDAIVPPGGGPPPHIHRREEESFYILEGEITFFIDGQRIVATAGQFANVSSGTLHAFKNESDRPARMLITVAPAGLEQMFLEVGTLLPAGTTQAPPPSQEDIHNLLQTAPKYGIEIHVPQH
jgi:quercetin dioxygenase-like cupin family protein